MASEAQSRPDLVVGDDDDDGVLSLSADTFAALQEFYDEQEARENEKRAVPTACTDDDGEISIDSFGEDWQLSQFWYDDKTADLLARECLRQLPDQGSVACISCPTVYFALRRHLMKTGDSVGSVKLFEFDKRFSRVGKDFVFFDYKVPLDIPRELRERFDLVFADPPFLSEECLTKTAVTIKFLAKGKIVLCTGEPLPILRPIQ